MLRRGASLSPVAIGLVAMLPLGILSNSSPSVARYSQKALFVVGSERLSPADEAVRSCLEKLGFSVDAFPAGRTAVSVAEMAAGASVIVISGSVPAEAARGKFARTPIPIVVWNP